MYGGSIQVNPNDMLGPIYETLGEGLPHVDAFTEQAGYEWRSWCQDRERIQALIREPLLNYWAQLSSKDQYQLRITLTYLLNVDEHVPYEKYKWMPELELKARGVGQKYFSSYQDTVQPLDAYNLCLWMWQILFGTENWHENVASWS